MKKILLVDDDALSLEFLKIFIESLGHEVRCAANLEEAYAAAAELNPGILITDLSLGEESGAGIINFMREKCPAAKIFVLSGYDRSVLEEEKLYFDHHLSKPVDFDILQKLIS